MPSINSNSFKKPNSNPFLCESERLLSKETLALRVNTTYGTFMLPPLDISKTESNIYQTEEAPLHTLEAELDSSASDSETNLSPVSSPAISSKEESPERSSLSETQSIKPSLFDDLLKIASAPMTVSSKAPEEKVVNSNLEKDTLSSKISFKRQIGGTLYVCEGILENELCTGVRKNFYSSGWHDVTEGTFTKEWQPINAKYTTYRRGNELESIEEGTFKLSSSLLSKTMLNLDGDNCKRFTPLGNSSKEEIGQFKDGILICGVKIVKAPNGQEVVREEGPFDPASETSWERMHDFIQMVVS